MCLSEKAREKPCVCVCVHSNMEKESVFGTCTHMDTALVYSVKLTQLVAKLNIKHNNVK